LKATLKFNFDARFAAGEAARHQRQAIVRRCVW